MILQHRLKKLNKFFERGLHRFAKAKRGFLQIFMMSYITFKSNILQVKSESEFHDFTLIEF